MQKQAYGIYLLHFIPLIWLQYLVTDPPLPAFAQIRDCLRWHVVGELARDHGPAQNSDRRANDLKTREAA